MQQRLKKVTIVLALGAMISIVGIASCKKSKSNMGNSMGTSRPLYSGQNYQQVQTPLPSTLLLVGSGLVGLGLLGWKKRSKP